ncbi:MAG: DUF2851 family protein [Ignavibacteriaceae bacterium]
MITNKSRIPEEVIYRIWQEKDYTNGFTSSDGLDIEIIDPGHKNNDMAGPDFHNARIRIGNLTFNGDVEIDNFQSDWRAHGHHLNKRYNKLILHIALSDESHHGYVTTQSGRKVHSIVLEKYLNQPIRKKLIDHLKLVREEDKLRMPCTGLSADIDFQFKHNYLKEFGLLRHRKKCEKFLHRLKELIILQNNQFKEPVVKYDFENEIKKKQFASEEFQNKNIWQQLFYEQVFEALGYVKNKNIMLRLSSAADIKFIESLNPTQRNIKSFESILFNISGLIPSVDQIADEETSEYLRSLVETWAEIRTLYDGETLNQSDWNFFRLRPQNFPTVRIAAGARMLNLITEKNLVHRLINSFEGITEINKLISRLRNMVIIKGEGYWASHFNFNKPVKSKIKYFLGLARADEIIINIILPMMSLYFDLFENRDNAEKVLNVYVNYKQKESNKLVDDVSNVLGLSSGKLESILHQGMIELFRGYCIKQRCMECEIGKSVFN